MTLERSEVEEQETYSRLNVPLVAAAMVMVVVGLLLTLSVALMWLGLPLMAIGVIWGVAIFLSAKFRAKARDTLEPH